MRLLVFAALLGFAFILDNRWEKESVEIADNNTQKNHDTEEPGIVYFFVQCNTTFSAKVLTQISVRKLFQQSHDKFIQKYHQLRNYQLLKCEAKNLKKPCILILYFLEFKNGSGNLSDEIPLIS